MRLATYMGSESIPLISLIFDTLWPWKNANSSGLIVATVSFRVIGKNRQPAHEKNIDSGSGRNWTAKHRESFHWRQVSWRHHCPMRLYK